MSEIDDTVDATDELAPLTDAIAATLPSGWKLETLGSLCEKSQYGWTTKADKDGQGVKFLRTTDITPGVVDWERVPFCVEEPPDLEKYLIREGDLLISRTGSIGVNYLVSNPEPAVFASYLIRFRPKKNVSTKYLRYYLQSPTYWRAIAAGKKGIAVQNVNATMLSKIPVPVAPDSEQLEIVAEIEKQFSRLDEAVANLKRVKANLKRYKASVLNDAVEGRLVEGEYQYEMVKLGSVANLVDPQPSHRTPPTHLDGVPYIGIGDVLANGKVDLQNSRKVSPTVLEEHRARYTLRLGDFIFGKIGTLGKPTLLLPPYDYTLSANIVLVQADGVRLLPEYALIFMESPKLVNMVNRDAKATTQAAYGIKRMRDLDMELPTVEVQKRIISEVDRRLSLIRGVESEVDANLKRAQALRQATLQRAFQD